MYSSSNPFILINSCLLVVTVGNAADSIYHFIQCNNLCRLRVLHRDKTMMITRVIYVHYIIISFVNTE